MITGLRSILGSTSDENSSIVGLNRAKSDRNIEVNVQYLPLFPLVIDVIKCHDLLVKFEKMNFVCSNNFQLLLILVVLRAVYHSDASLGKIVSHSELRISIERNILCLGSCIDVRVSILKASIIFSLRIYRASSVHTASIVCPGSLNTLVVNIHIVLSGVCSKLRLRN